MSLGELLACAQGAIVTSGGCLTGGKMVVPPDNRCCFCLTLRTGVLLIGAFNFILYTLAFLWYAVTTGFQSGFGDSEVSNVDISIFAIFCVQLMVNLLLMVGAVRKVPHHTFPWLCSNAVVIGILMIFVVMLVFMGTGRYSLNYQEYVASLSILALLAGTNLFCCIVVFQFRQNLLLEARIAAAVEAEGCQVFPSCPALATGGPPPSYEELRSIKVPLEQGPPEYEAAVAMLLDSTQDMSSSPGAVQRKKSLTHNGV